MKNMIAVIVLICAAQLISAQSYRPKYQQLGKPHTLDDEIEMRVNKQTTPEQKAQAARQEIGTVRRSRSYRPIQANRKDPRIVTLNGVEYRLRKPEKFTTYYNEQKTKNTYVSNQNDTIEVYDHYPTFGGEESDPAEYGSPRSDMTTTSMETKYSKKGGMDAMCAHQQKNADGTCRYVVQRTYDKGAQSKLGARAVVIKRHLPAIGEEEIRELQRATYQGLAKTKIDRTFKEVGPAGNNIYGPETYPKK